MINTSGFISIDHRASFERFFSQWTHDPNRIKKALTNIIESLQKNRDTILKFYTRPGISYSLRASVKAVACQHRPYYAVIDIVEEVDGDKWLSVCFYADTITDPEQLGNLIPKGLLNEDGYCFDVDTYDEALLSYVGGRIAEAYHAYISK